MKYIIALTFIVQTVYCRSQNNPVEIILTTDSVVQSDHFSLRYSPIFRKPFIKMYDNNLKVKIKDIASYEGVDKFENYRILKTDSYNYWKGQTFNERLFLEEHINNVNIYYDRITFGGIENASSIEFNYYKIGHQDFKTLNIRNISRDLKKSTGQANKDLKGAARIRMLQFSSALIGAAILTNLIVVDSSKADHISPNQTNSIGFFASGILLTFPLTLEKLKKSKLKNAIKAY